jgi:ligand-binding sensor domain-containing protein/signal transduction histidine kinase
MKPIARQSPTGLWYGAARYAADCLLVCLLAVNTARALDPHRYIAQYAHSAWTIQDGYLHGSATSIAQTADGYIWIGTEAGLVRFDGVRFSSWEPPGESPLSFASSQITSLLASRDGSLWIAAHVDRVQQYISHWNGRRLSSQTIDGLAISSLLETRSGAIWIAGPFCQVMAGGLSCHGATDGMPSSSGQVLAEDTAGNIWLGDDMRLIRWNHGSSTVYTPASLKANNGESGVTAIVPDQDGTVWAGLYVRGPGGGLQHFIQGQWRDVVMPGFDGRSVEVTDLLLDRHGALWIGTNDDGLYRIYAGEVNHYRSQNGLSGDYVMKLYEDGERNLWVGTSKGIDRFRDNRIATYSMAEGLCTTEVDSVLATRDGTLWIGGSDALGFLRQGRISCIKKDQGLPGYQVTSLFEDHSHQLWVGINDTMTLYENGQFTPIARPDGKPLGLVVSITEDTDHNIWLVTGGSHRALLRIKDRKVQEELTEPQIPVPHIVAADPAGGVWLGLMDGGLTRYHNGRAQTYRLASFKSLVMQLSVDSDGSVLAATAAGLVGWKQGKLVTMTTRNGLPCDAVNTFIKDRSGDLWLYMSCGLVRISVEELQRWWRSPQTSFRPRILDTLDGLQPGRAPFQSSARTPDGRLWFANRAVLQTIDPSNISGAAPAPPVHVEQINSDQRSYRVDEPLRLAPHTHRLEIDYTAPSFAIPQRVRFRYILEGYDTEWQDAGTRRQAFYTDLRPRKYRFRVTASSEDGVWSDKGATVDFTITPAWYQTRWFLAGCIVAALLLTWTLYRLRMRQVARALNARFDERLAERTRIARELHDTLMQTIQASALLADSALYEVHDATRTRLAVEKLTGWLQRAVEEGRTVLESLYASTTQTNDLAVALKSASEQHALQDHRMVVLFSKVGESRELHPLVRDEVCKIAEEAIRNALAHSRGTRLEIELRYNQDVAVRVGDDGIGIEATLVTQGKKGHFGLQGMRERASRVGGTLTIRTAVNSGTDIEIVVPGRVAYRNQRSSAWERLKARLHVGTSRTS